MKIIAHRANLNGPDRETENTYKSIKKAINLGFDVEIDVWYVNKQLYIGHDFDKARYYDNIESFLYSYYKFLWIHCKNIEAMIHLLPITSLNLFGHDNDEFVLTTHHNIFRRPGLPPNKNSIIVMPEMTPIYTEEDLNNCYGICTDYPINVKEKNHKLFMS
jgi:hypothetical protein